MCAPRAHAAGVQHDLRSAAKTGFTDSSWQPGPADGRQRVGGRQHGLDDWLGRQSVSFATRALRLDWRDVLPEHWHSVSHQPAEPCSAGVCLRGDRQHPGAGFSWHGIERQPAWQLDSVECVVLVDISAVVR